MTELPVGDWRLTSPVGVGPLSRHQTAVSCVPQPAVVARPPAVRAGSSVAHRIRSAGASGSRSSGLVEPSSTSNNQSEFSNRYSFVAHTTRDVRRNFQ